MRIASYCRGHQQGLFVHVSFFYCGPCDENAPLFLLKRLNQTNDVFSSFFLFCSWGDKENGVAGHGDTEGHQYTPKLLERLNGKKVVQLSACGFHTGCLTNTQEVYTWGEVSVNDDCKLLNIFHSS